ncbi:hypothetical protein GGD41_005821 [Paraburkholderia bryophila]|uniref:NUDIX domain-containing protein n=1 Tax=Paraburkholderia bryophila TaxID=420952 RepID=A0A7Y9WEW9_9BURK|nr:hypothetical protein [Paraburkholderia bryophila]
MPRNPRIRITHVEPLSNSWNRLDKFSLDYVRADGETQALTREIYHVDDGATVLLYDATRCTVILVRQFRLPAYLRGGSGDLLETPAGFLDGADPEGPHEAGSGRRDRLPDRVDEKSLQRVDGARLCHARGALFRRAICTR